MLTVYSKPKTYLVPERERTEPPPRSPWSLVSALMRFEDREIIKKCGLDAYFFLRYLKTLLVIFVPIAVVVIPILVPLNYVGGMGRHINVNTPEELTNLTESTPVGLDTLAWGNVAPKNQTRRWGHLLLALFVIIWVCGVFFAELRVYVKVRQDYLTSAEHRLRASANTVLVSSIPEKWLTEEALRGLFDVFPGGIRNVWLTRDFTKLLEKIHKRDAIHKQLEAAETELIRAAKRKQLKRQAAEEKLARKASHGSRETKAERLQRQKNEDVEAQRRAAGPGGMSVGDHDSVPHDIRDAVHEAERRNTNDLTGIQEEEIESEGGFSHLVGGGLSKVGRGLNMGLRKGVGLIGGAGQGVVGGAKAFTQGIDGELERTGGFDFVGNEHQESSPTSTLTPDLPHEARPKASFASEAPLQDSSRGHRQSPSDASQDSELRKEIDPRSYGNTTRKVSNLDAMYVTEKAKWYQFWKPPTGSYASPVPQGVEGDEYPWKKEEKSGWQKFKSKLPFLGDDEPEMEYPIAHTIDYTVEKEQGPEWEKWIKAKNRPHHYLPLFEWTPGWFPGFPYIHKKVDTIYWCRTELARLNMEIEEDQQHPERYPIMNSAFIQFNNQVAAHMACQSVTHHIPKQMTPRVVEISPNDVIWDNMAIKWWDEWGRRAVVAGIVFGMVLLWAFPVAWTASLATVVDLIEEYDWLQWLNTDTIKDIVGAVAGVLPALVLAVLLILVPLIFDLLAGFQGAKTGSQRSEAVQAYYFTFLFVQVFLVVSIASGALKTLTSIGEDISSTPTILAKNLPKASNYFFSYMILQALSNSSGTLLQIGTLFVWYILSRILDNTAREKWTRNTQLPSVTWGSFFPVYTNFACIALIYSVIAPLISLFAIITFSLLWFAHRYNMLYVIRFKTDTGGVLYPRAINQTFVGLYVMELCLIGLFFLARDEQDNVACTPQAIIMIIALALTGLYQYLLNSSFGPLFRYLPITFEDEAVLRDEAFQRAQNRRLGILDEEDEEDEASALNRSGDASEKESNINHPNDGNKEDIELQKVKRSSHHSRGASDGSFRLGKLNPVKGIVRAGTWATHGGKRVRAATVGKAEENLRTAATYRSQQRQKDLEEQRKIGDALYGGYHDEIEDLTPEERDVLVRKAFQHYALRARRPTVWIPRDDIGVSDDELRRTIEFSKYIWISNEGTALDSKVRVVYGKNPPDFSEVDLINL